ncbi:unnamed protein product [Rhodiola kirilowii]
MAFGEKISNSLILSPHATWAAAKLPPLPFLHMGRRLLPLMTSSGAFALLHGLLAMCLHFLHKLLLP